MIRCERCYAGNGAHTGWCLQLDSQRDKITELEAALAAAQKDAERWVWWMSDKPKPGATINDYLQGVREHWTLNQWRAWADAAIDAEMGATPEP